MALDEYLASFTDRDWDEGPHDDTVRVAMLGLGWWTRDEAIPAVAESDYCETTVVVSGSAEKAERVAEDVDTVEAGITYEQFHDGAATGAYDAVYICTPNATHLEFVSTAADLGKDVLCEKPMAADSEGARRMVEVCADAGVTLMIAYRMQTEPAVRRAREIVQSGAIGDVVHVHGHMSDDLLDLVPDPDQWRLDRDLAGGTTVNDIGIYPLNTARFVLDRDPVAVYGTTHAVHEAFEGTDERTAFQVEFPGAVTAACTATHRGEGASHLKFLGTDGELTVEPVFFPWDDRELVLRHRGARSEVTFEQVNQMTEEFDYFADCLLSGRDPVPDGEHGLRDIELIEAIYESAETGERVPV